MIHGENDTLAVVRDAREFVETLRRTSANTVIFAELRGAQHSFDVFRSPRMEAVIDAAQAFGEFETGKDRR